MNGKVKFALTAVLLAVFAVAFAGEALAAKNPDWVKWSWSTSLVRNDKVNDSSPDRYSIKISVTHKNNSSNKDMIAIYDKTVTFSATIANVYTIAQYGKAVKKTITSDKINEINVWPGKSYTLVFFIPVKNLISVNKDTATVAYSWVNVNRDLAKYGMNTFTKRSLNYSYHVRSKKN